MIISEAKITIKRQITLPIKVMRKLRIKPGEMIIFEEHNNHIEILPGNSNFTIDDFINKHTGRSKIKLTQEQLNKGREGAWTNRYKSYNKNSL